MKLRKMPAGQSVTWLLAGVDPQSMGELGRKGSAEIGIFLRGSDFISDFEE